MDVRLRVRVCLIASLRVVSFSCFYQSQMRQSPLQRRWLRYSMGWPGSAATLLPPLVRSPLAGECRDAAPPLAHCPTSKKQPPSVLELLALLAPTPAAAVGTGARAPPIPEVLAEIRGPPPSRLIQPVCLPRVAPGTVLLLPRLRQELLPEPRGAAGVVRFASLREVGELRGQPAEVPGPPLCGVWARSRLRHRLTLARWQPAQRGQPDVLEAPRQQVMAERFAAAKELLQHAGEAGV